jgi:hypothetical protein
MRGSLQLNKCCERFIRPNDKVFSVIAVCINDPDRLPVRSYDYDATQRHAALLRHNSQREVIAIAAFVAHLVSVAVGSEDRTVWKVAERAGDRVR